MNKVLVRQAHDELNQAVKYYEERQTGLGLRMLKEVKQHVDWIMENPRTPRLRKARYRRINLKTFPYYIAWMIHDETIWILAIAHNHKKPEYWISRSTQKPTSKPSQH